MKPDAGQKPGDAQAKKRTKDGWIAESQFSNAVIDSILGVFYVLDREGNFVRDNRYHQVVLGYSAEEILKMNALDTIAEEDRDLIASKIREVFEKGFTTVSAHILTRDGRKIPYLFTGYPTEIDGKQYLVGMGVDISEQVKAEQDYKSILDNIQDGFYRSDIEGNLIMISPSGARTLGYRSPEEIAGWNIPEKFYADPEERQELLEAMGKCGLVENYEVKIRKRDGTIITVALNSHLYYDSRGRPAGIEGIFRDITERKQFEEALKTSENMYRAIFNNTGAATIIIAGDTTIKLANSGWERLTGIPRELQENQIKWPRFFEKAEAERMQQYHYARRRDPALAPAQYECKLIDIRQEAHYCIAYVAMIPGTTDSVASMVDITDRKKAEIALRESEEKFRVLADTSPAAIMVYQGDQMVYANDYAARLSGYTKAELIGSRFWEDIHPAYREVTRQRALARQRGEKVQTVYEIKTIGKNGRERWALLSAGNIVYEGKPAVIVMLQDITDRKHAEEALADAKNQAELFLDLMGHDISNMNQIGVGYLEMAQEVLKLDEPAREFIEKPLETLYDSSRLIADVNKLQRIATCELKLEKTEVRQKLLEVIAAYEGRAGIKTTITHPPFGNCLVMANEMLYDAFANIIWDCVKNAEEKNVIEIRLAKRIENGQPRCVVTIENHGTGLSDEQKILLFEQPKKGMKRTGGRGIGLYLTKSIVDLFHGSLKVEDLEPGDYTRGTRFIIDLPACEETIGGKFANNQ